ncbi:hypothetical protein [Flavimaricola marinus]|uniref:Uncharacterized protein n=1 Tax=Flavimaricola marinus TaxID=1819565 RepID=A0A238LF27_9RHOB|nr:hypothetical protein [Flavimaricola marinus]SMY08192.1 hypothetical protein LOM8899_02342 [Flavimaricola marinus]
MRILALAAAIAIAVPATSQAQSVIEAYYAEISQRDMFNSSGTRLTDLGAILQQDRANVHRFGKRDPSDEIDPFFGDRSLRAQIPQLYARGDTDPLIARIITGGSPLQVLVLLCGGRAQPEYLVVDFADGDGNRGC